MQTLSCGTTLQGLATNPSCAVITSGNEFKVRFTPTAKTFSFSFTMKNSPVAISAAVTDALCKTYTDSDYSVQKVSQAISAFTPSSAAVTNTRIASVTTSSNNNTKQCSNGFPHPTKTGETDLTLTLTVDNLGTELDLSRSEIVVHTPMRYSDYQESSKFSGMTRESMIMANNPGMSIIYKGNTYRASTTQVMRDSGSNSDQVKGYFSVYETQNPANPIKISAGSGIEIKVDSIQNPSSTKNTLTAGWKVYFNYKGTSAYESREDTSDGKVASGLSTCVNTSTQASVSAVIGNDRVGSKDGIWRFQFTTFNTWPSQSSLRITLPDSVSTISTNAYDFACNTGCIASSASITPTKNGQALTFPNAFSASVEAGTIVDITIGNWTHPSTESALEVFFEIIWVDIDQSTWQIDQFQNSGELTGPQPLSSEAYGNTFVLITDAAKRQANTDCRIIPPQRYEAPKTIGSLGSPITIETSSYKFTTSGKACSGRDSFNLSAYAKLSDGTRMSPLYTLTQFDENGLIQVILTTQADNRSTTESHAVFVQVSDAADYNSKNLFCFMVYTLADSSAYPQKNYCRDICQETLLTQASENRVESLEYLIKNMPSSVSFTNEFQLNSHNPVMCPVIYQSGTPAKTHSQVGQVINNYDASTGTFQVSTSSTDMLLPGEQSIETYNFLAATNAFTKNMPFKVYLQGCSDAIVLPVNNFSIKATLDWANGETANYSHTDIGFESQDPDNCPLKGLRVKYTFCTAEFKKGVCSGATSLENYWSSGRNNTLQLDATPSTTSTEQTVYILATFGSTNIKIENKIKVQINNCDKSTWNCDSCDPAKLTLSSYLPAKDASAIRNNLSGCTSCAAPLANSTDERSFLEYKLDKNNNWNLQCSEDVRRRELSTIVANTTCGVGLLYDDDLTCTRTCSSVLTGCSTCTSNLVCTACTESTFTPTAYTDVTGVSRTDCLTEQLWADRSTTATTTCTATNCKTCSSASASVCEICNIGYYLDTTCQQISDTVDPAPTFIVKASTGVVDFSASVSTINAATGAVGAEFWFLPQVFYTVYNDNAYLDNEKVTVTIQLETGDHYLFACHNDLYSAYTWTDGSVYTQLCSVITGLKPVHPRTDNIEFKIEPKTANTEVNVHVLDPYFYFNVTNSMTFKQINFRGESALATPVDSSITPVYPPLATIPLKKCVVQATQKECESYPGVTCPTSDFSYAETWGTHQQLTLAVNPDLTSSGTASIAALSALYTCTDSLFETPSVPMTALQTCAQTQDSSTIQSVRACPGEPYDSNYFEFDSSSRLPYKRTKTLFSLYNWDLQQSYQKYDSSTKTSTYATLNLQECKFDYFLAGYTSLINVETNNMAIVNTTVATVVKSYVLEMGDTRGVNIAITQTSFATSRFCKGLITFKKRPTIYPSSTDVKIFRLSEMNLPAPTEASVIKISESTMYNLNFGKVITTLSLLNNATYPIDDMWSVKYPTFDNHGAVLNLQGFPGSVKISESTINNNMAFIPDVYPSKRSWLDEKEALSSFTNSETGQIMMTRCNSTNYVKRFFGDYLNSLDEQPAYELSQLEKYSPIFISLPQNPVIFDANTFENNVGIFGGSISIDTQNHWDDFRDTDEYQPYVLISGNTFNLTQSYLSGNALYIHSTRQRGSTNELTEVCGGGVNIEKNTFSHTAPVIHASNGGAVSLECDFVSIQNSTEVGSSQQNSLAPFKTILFSDILQNSQGRYEIYRTYKYATALLQNTFQYCSAGQKGSVIFARQVSNIMILENVFDSNRPAMQMYTNAVDMPYQRLLVARQQTGLSNYGRPILYHNAGQERNIDEWEYFRLYATSYAEGGLIPMPQMQGAIYYESCQTCLISHKETWETINGCSFCHSLVHNVVIKSNTFTNNEDAMTFYAEHSLPKSSILFAKGGSNYTIEYNTISYAPSGYAGSTNIVLQNYYMHLPDNYFNSLQSPLFRLNVPYGDQIHFDNNTVSQIQTVQPIFDIHAYNSSLLQLDSAPSSTNFTVSDNDIDDIVSFGDYMSLFYADGATLTASGNKFSRIGHLNHNYQNFTQDEYFFTDTNPEDGCPDSFACYFPVDKTLWSNRTWTQGKGIFWMRSGVRSTTTNTTVAQKHQLKNNEFKYLFCQEGCVIRQTIPDQAEPQYFEFEGNTFKSSFGINGALIYSVMEPQSDDSTYAVFNFTDDTIQQVKNGGIRLEGFNNDIALMMNRVKVIDSFGDAAQAVVDLTQGHIFISKDFNVTTGIIESTVTEQFDQEGYQFLIDERQSYEEYINATTYEKYFESSQSQKATISIAQVSAAENITADANFTSLIIDDILVGHRLAPDYQFINQINNTNHTWEGAVFSDRTDMDSFIARNFTSQEYQDWLLGLPDFFPSSIITNSTFYNVVGHGDVIEVADMELEIRTTEFYGNKLNGTFASTMRAKGGQLVLKEGVTFTNNDANAGGALFLSHSANLTANKTDFSHNTAKRTGGAINMRDAGIIHLNRATITNNQALDGAAIWAGNGLDLTSITAISVIFTDNFGYDSVVKLEGVAMMDVQNCIFVDNYATSITHGFSSIHSNINIYNTLIKNTVPFRVASRQLSIVKGNQSKGLPRLMNDQAQVGDEQQPNIAGFFYLTSQSTMTMSHSQMQGTLGKIASTIYLTSGSQVTLEEVRLTYLEAPSDCAYENNGVIVASQGGAIRVRGSTLIQNRCTYIYADRTPVELKDSVFSDSQESSYVQVFGSVLSVHNTTLQNTSRDYNALGRGLLCSYCSQVMIKESTFTNLAGNMGGAIYVDNSLGGYFEDNVFSKNTARQGGAVFVSNSWTEFRNNTFQSNNADAYDINESVNQQTYLQNQGKGGAIFFTCIDNDDPFAEFVVTTATECVLGTADYNACIQTQQRNTEETKGAKIGKQDNNDECQLNIDENTFEDNTSVHDGFDIYWTNKNLTEIIPYVFICEGTDFDGTPANCVKNPAKTVELTLVEQTEFQRILPDWDIPNSDYNTRGVLVFTSGVPVQNLQVKLIDDKGNYKTDQNTSIATLIFKDVFFNEKSEGKEIKKVIKGAQSFARDGVWTFENLDLTLTPGESIQVELSISNFDGYGKYLSWIEDKNSDSNQNYNFIFQSRNCIAGERYTTDHECLPCIRPAYSFTPLEKPRSCPPCPDYGVCLDKTLYPAAGYCRLQELSEVFVRCFNEAACEQGDKEDRLTNCAEGYDGVMCASCDESYWKPWGTYKCYKCTADILSTLKFFLCPLLLLWLVGVISKIFLRNFTLANQQTIAIIRIFINTQQTFYIMSTMMDDASLLGVNTYLKLYQDYKLSALLPMNWLFDLQCMDHFFGFDNLTKFYITLEMYALMPLILLILNFVYWFFVMVCGSICNPDGGFRFVCRRLTNRVAVTYGILMFMIYPNVVHFLMQATMCFDSLVTEEGADVIVQRLRMNPEVICNDSQYTMHLYGLIMPGLFLYVLVIPILAIRSLNEKAEYVYWSGQKSQFEQDLKERTIINDLKSYYGFFFSGLNLGKSTYKKAVTNKDDEDPAKAQARALAAEKSKNSCIGKFKKAIKSISGFTGGVEVTITGGQLQIAEEDQEYTKSFYYWEFISLVEKFILSAMVVYLAPLNQGLQANLVLIINIISLFIHFFGSPYYKPSLNVLNWGIRSLILFFILTRVLVRSASNGEASVKYDEYLGSYTGLPVAEEFIIISRSKAFGSDAAIIEVGILVPIMLYMTYNDFQFISNFVIQIFSLWIQQGKTSLFKSLTCNLWNIKDFRDKYMNEALGEDENIGDNLEEPTLNLKLTQQHAVKEDKDKEGAAEGKDPAEDSAEEKSDSLRSSRSSEVDHKDINLQQKHTTYRSNRTARTVKSDRNNLKMPQEKPKSELGGLAMALGIKNPHAGPQKMLYADIQESDESESKSSFYGDNGDNAIKMGPLETDRSSAAKKGLLNSEQKLPGSDSNENIQLGGGNIPVSGGQRGSEHPEQKDGQDSEPELNDSRPMGIDNNNLDDDPVVALAHQRMLKEGMKSAKTRMSRIDEEEDNEARLSQSQKSRPKSQIRPNAIANLLDDEDEVAVEPDKSNNGGNKSRSQSRGRKSRKTGKSGKSGSKIVAALEDPDKALQKEIAQADNESLDGIENSVSPSKKSGAAAKNIFKLKGKKKKNKGKKK